MKWEFLKVKDLPRSIRDAVKAVDPAGARRRQYMITLVESVKVPVSYWDGGSRTHLDAVRLDGTPVKMPTAYQPGGHFSNPNTWVEPTYDIPDGVIVVQHGITCGRTSFPHLRMSQGTWDKANR
jgi:hypothetical protein